MFDEKSPKNMFYEKSPKNICLTKNHPKTYFDKKSQQKHA